MEHACGCVSVPPSPLPTKCMSEATLAPLGITSLSPCIATDTQLYGTGVTQSRD